MALSKSVIKSKYEVACVIERPAYKSFPEFLTIQLYYQKSKACDVIIWSLVTARQVIQNGVCECQERIQHRCSGIHKLFSFVRPLHGKTTVLDQTTE